MDPGATHSFVSPISASKLSWQATRVIISLSLDTDVILLRCLVLVEGRELLVDFKA